MHYSRKRVKQLRRDEENSQMRAEGDSERDRRLQQTPEQHSPPLPPSGMARTMHRHQEDTTTSFRGPHSGQPGKSRPEAALTKATHRISRHEGENLVCGPRE